MLNTMSSTDERVTTAHRAKLAYVYVRQSSPGQVRHHQESTELQYRLVERAILLGWPRERVQVIDDDPGKTDSLNRSQNWFSGSAADPGRAIGRSGDDDVDAWLIKTHSASTGFIFRRSAMPRATT